MAGEAERRVNISFASEKKGNSFSQSVSKIEIKLRRSRGYWVIGDD
jgi:hypothetical protein